MDIRYEYQYGDESQYLFQYLLIGFFSLSSSRTRSRMLTIAFLRTGWNQSIDRTVEINLECADNRATKALRLAFGRK